MFLSVCKYVKIITTLFMFEYNSSCFTLSFAGCICEVMIGKRGKLHMIPLNIPANEIQIDKVFFFRLV